MQEKHRVFILVEAENALQPVREVILHRSACNRGYKRGVREGVIPRSRHREWKVCTGGSVFMLYRALSMCMDDLLCVGVSLERDPASSFYSSQGGN
jgi:hypothetical protein